MKITHLQQIFWANIFRQRKDRELSLLGFLKKVPLFDRLKKWQLKGLAKVLHRRSYETNEYLFEQGQPGAALFIIESGEVSVEAGLPEQPDYTQFTVLHSGSFLGELALLDQTPRSASARAVKPTVCYALFRNDLDRLVETQPAIASSVYKGLASIVGERLKAKNELVLVKKGA